MRANEPQKKARGNGRQQEYDDGRQKRKEQRTGVTWKRKSIYTRTKTTRRGDEGEREGEVR